LKAPVGESSTEFWKRLLRQGPFKSEKKNVQGGTMQGRGPKPRLKKITREEILSPKAFTPDELGIKCKRCHEKWK